MTGTGEDGNFLEEHGPEIAMVAALGLAGLAMGLAARRLRHEAGDVQDEPEATDNS